MGTRNKQVAGVVALVGIVAAAVSAVGASTQAQAAPVTVQVLGTNDYHGRLLLEAPNGGAAVLAGAVDQLSTTYPNTTFAAAGDLIGASTFESFIQQDVPTIDVLNEAGLEVSATGNHEFDQGWADLRDRVLPLADWEYLAANVRLRATGGPALPETWVETFGDVQVGFVGAVTEDLPSLVSPGGITDLQVTRPITAANAAADALKAGGADLVILLVHEGAATTALSSAVDPASKFGDIVLNASPNIDAIVSGHTHLAYNHRIPVPAWASDPNRPVKDRPVVSAGQYGFALNQLLFSVDPTTGQVVGLTTNPLPLLTGSTPNYPPDPAVAAIVAQAVRDAETLGNVPLGEITGPLNRAKRSNAAGAIEENRGGESTLGNLVAEIQQDATSAPEFGGAQIAFMNPGGLRQDLIGVQPTGTPPPPPVYPATVTYRQAAVVQPFANTLVNMTLTGAQIRQVLEQQWQPAGASRPFLRLGISEGFRYTYDPAGAAGNRITAMWLDDVPVTPTATYSVTVNSFLSTGGDNFGALIGGTNKRDTGQIDLQAAVEYIGANTPIAPDYTQRSVGISFPAGAPAAYGPGDAVTFAVSSLLLPAVPAGGAGTSDSAVDVAVDGTVVGTFPVNNTVPVGALFDEAGAAAVSFPLPSGLAAGPHRVTIVGTTTGSTAELTIRVDPAASTLTLTPAAATQVYGAAETATLTATVTIEGGTLPTGSVSFSVNGGAPTAVPLAADGTAAFSLPSSTPAGTYTVTASYAGTPGLIAPSSATATITVEKATSTTVLLSTRTTQRQGSIIPTILVSATGLNNGRIPQGHVEFRRGDTVVARVGMVIGLSLYFVPRNLAVGSYTYTATFVPSDAANVTGSTSNPVTITVTR